MDPKKPINRDAKDEDEIEKLREMYQKAVFARYSREYLARLKFICEDGYLSPFNRNLIFSQKPGATMVASEEQWYIKHKRFLNIDAVPIATIRMGCPVQFVYDVSDTSVISGYEDILLKKSENKHKKINTNIDLYIKNLIYGVNKYKVDVYYTSNYGLNLSGEIKRLDRTVVKKNDTFSDVSDKKESTEYKREIRYELAINSRLDKEMQLATMIHEVGHLFCGHLGKIEIVGGLLESLGHENLAIDVKEFQAESISFIVCNRLGISTSSEKFLRSYIGKNGNIPEINFDRMLKIAGIIESMCKKEMKKRK